MLKLINDTDRKAILCDVIFVHGFISNSADAWHTADDKAISWPSWLLNDISGIRLWHLEWSSKAESIYDLTTTCLAQIEASDIGRYPVVFVTHSMGGILLKQMMRNVSDGIYASLQPLLPLIRGVVFIATPHAGSGLANWFHILGKAMKVSGLLGKLKKDNDYLHNLNKWFNAYLPHHEHDLLVFYEKVRTKGAWIVDKRSANPNIVGIEPIGLELNHHDICKPKDQSTLLYSSVKTFIERQVSRYSEAEFELESIPSTRGFIARTSIMKQIRKELAETNIGVIEGAFGVGKTWLGARTAANYPKNKRFWFKFTGEYEYKGIDILWNVAYLFHANGNSQLLNALQNNSSQSLGAYLPIMRKGFSKDSYLLCFDNVHLVEDNGEIQYIFQEMASQAIKKPKILFIGITKPSFVLSKYPPIPGYNLQELNVALKRQNLRLSEEAKRQLLRKTSGRPKSIDRVLSHFRTSLLSQEDRYIYIEHLPLAPENDDYISKTVHENYSDSELDVLLTLSLARKPVRSGIIRTIFPEYSVDRILKRLLEYKDIFIMTNRRYDVHDIMREYLVAISEEDKVRQLHNALGRAFETDILFTESSYHYLKSQDYHNTIRVLAERIDPLIQSGNATHVNDLFRRLRELRIQEIETPIAKNAYGRSLRIAGHFMEAEQMFTEARELCDRDNSSTQIASYNELAETMRMRGYYKGTIHNYEKALELSETTDNVNLCIQSLCGLGRVERLIGNYASAIKHYDRALPLLGVRKTGLMAETLWGLARTKMKLGKHNDALSLYLEAQEISEIVKDKYRWAEATWGLAEALLKLNNISESERIFTMVLEAGKKLGSPPYALGWGYIGLASNQYSLKKFDESKLLLEEGMKCSQSVGDTYGVVTNSLYYSEILRCEGKIEKAHEKMTQAKEVAEKYSYHPEYLHTQLLECKFAELDETIAIEDFERLSRAYRKIDLPWGEIHTLISKYLYVLNTGGNRDDSLDYASTIISNNVEDWPIEIALIDSIKKESDPRIHFPLIFP